MDDLYTATCCHALANIFNRIKIKSEVFRKLVQRFILTALSLLFFSINSYASVSTQEINFVSKSSGRTLVGEIYYPLMQSRKKEDPARNLDERK